MLFLLWEEVGEDANIEIINACPKIMKILNIANFYRYCKII